MSEFKAALADFICNDVARVLLAVVLVSGTLVLLVMDRTVPDVLWALDGAAISFYFSIAAVKMGNREFAVLSSDHLRSQICLDEIHPL